MTEQSSRYSLAQLRIHTDSIVMANREQNEAHYRAFDKAVQAFDRRLSELERESVSAQRNVLMLLATRLFNHMYSTLLLSEAGLIHDAVGCERSLWETLAAYFLVSVDSSAADDYLKNKFPRPKDVRARLQQLGYPELAKDIRNMFSPTSNILHISRRAERWHLSWSDQSSAKLIVGGSHAVQDHQHILGVFLAPFIEWFATFHRETEEGAKGKEESSS